MGGLGIEMPCGAHKNAPELLYSSVYQCQQIFALKWHFWTKDLNIARSLFMFQFSKA